MDPSLEIFHVLDPVDSDQEMYVVDPLDQDLKHCITLQTLVVRIKVPGQRHENLRIYEVSCIDSSSSFSQGS